MNNIFIKSININKVRHLENLTIKISDQEKKHLIITGKNGSGKTSLLNFMNIYFNAIQNNQLNQILNLKKNIENSEKYIKGFEQQLKAETLENQRIAIKQGINSQQNNIKIYRREIERYNSINLSIHNLEFLSSYCQESKFIIASFEAQRIKKFDKPDGIKKIDIKQTHHINDKANRTFIQYIVNLKAKRSFARDDNKTEQVENIDEWFNDFESFLKEIFDDEKLKLEFDSENFNFNIIQYNREKFDLNTLSDGYSAIINIVTELILRMEKNSAKNYNIPGIVLIDEIETHLHIELQKKILPFLTKFFPNIQFIVTTHSPFIINSLDNAVIYDLENHIQVEDLSGYSVEGIIEGYFKNDKYSIILKGLVKEYEVLVNTTKKSDQEKERFKYLKQYFKDLSKFMSPELKLKIQQLELINLEKI